mmetsp:Transcript_71865/g.126959  ORF Transcript_71865/g.126959 Transcript_71865/m.126959 type:complete len:82 (+) Transcript_71865:1351-1596(+)
MTLLLWPRLRAAQTQKMEFQSAQRTTRFVLPAWLLKELRISKTASSSDSILLGHDCSLEESLVPWTSDPDKLAWTLIQLEL